MRAIPGIALSLLCGLCGCGPNPAAALEGLYTGSVVWTSRPCDRPAEASTVVDEREWLVIGRESGAGMCPGTAMAECIFGELALEVIGARGRVAGAPSRFAFGESAAGEAVFGDVESASGEVYVTGGRMRGTIEMRWSGAECRGLRGEVDLLRQ